MSAGPHPQSPHAMSAGPHPQRLSHGPGAVPARSECIWASAECIWTAALNVYAPLQITYFKLDALNPKDPAGGNPVFDPGCGPLLSLSLSLSRARALFSNYSCRPLLSLLETASPLYLKQPALVFLPLTQNRPLLSPPLKQQLASLFLKQPPAWELAPSNPLPPSSSLSFPIFL
jgi:hypothetical protein